MAFGVIAALAETIKYIVENVHNDQFYSWSYSRQHLNIFISYVCDTMSILNTLGDSLKYYVSWLMEVSSFQEYHIVTNLMDISNHPDTISN